MKHNIFISFMLLMPMMASLSSCESWFDIKPDDELVSEDFWQSKSDVASAVAACYRALQEPDAMERLIAWGESRSDNVVAGMNPVNDMRYIQTANVDADNAYTAWASIYKVINYCNTVVTEAPGVCDRDPNFRQSELRAYLAEAKGVRALCYFYLVRTFKDVPYITVPYSDDTRTFQTPQTDGDAVIDSLIADLEPISRYAKAEFTTTADTKGRMTQKAIWALMADMYLWKNDYANAIDYCDRVLEAPTNPLSLEPSSAYNQAVFGSGNSSESIFELQFNTDTPDYVVNEMYGTQGGRSSVNNLSAANFTDYQLFVSSDIRQRDAFYATSSASFVPIYKYIAHRNETGSTGVRPQDYVLNGNTQHWIVYRLPDIYLMKAEALAELGGGSALEQALALVSRTFDRANPSRGANSLSLSSYGSQALMRDLVFDERQREFLFEGKRYFDILRRARRLGNVQSLVSKYLLRKYAGQDQATVLTKLNTLNALYMPINRNELKVNKLLVQNPFYATDSDIEQQK